MTSLRLGIDADAVIAEAGAGVLGTRFREPHDLFRAARDMRWHVGAMLDGFEDWYRPVHPRLVTSMAAVLGDPDLAREIAGALCGPTSGGIESGPWPTRPAGCTGSWPTGSLSSVGNRHRSATRALGGGEASGFNLLDPPSVLAVRADGTFPRRLTD